MNSENWNSISTAPEDEVVLTKIDDRDGERNVQKLIKYRNLWFFPDKSMYVYYTPTHWKELVSLTHGINPPSGKCEFNKDL